MKLIKFIIFLFIFTSYLFSKDNFSKYSFYFELFGPGIIYSTNLEYRWKINNSVRLGYSYIKIGSLFGSGEASEFRLIPITYNFLIGKRRGFLDVGLGNVLLISNEKIILLNPTITTGYRFHSFGNGFLFRIGLNLTIFKGSEEIYPIFIPYISIGFTLKWLKFIEILT